MTTPTPMSLTSRLNEMNRLEQILKNASIDAIVCEIVDAKTAIVCGATYADFLFARSILERQGWRVIKPGA